MLSYNSNGPIPRSPYADTVKTRVKEPTTLQVSLIRFLYIEYLVGNFRLFRFSYWLLFHSGLSRTSFVQIETSSPLFTASSKAPGFIRPHS